MQVLKANILNATFLNGGGYTLTAYKSNAYKTFSYKVNSHLTGEKATLQRGVAFFVVPAPDLYLNFLRNYSNIKYYGKNKTI